MAVGKISVYKYTGKQGLIMDPVNSTVCAEKYRADLVPDTMMCASPQSTMPYERCQGDIGGTTLLGKSLCINNMYSFHDFF